MEEVSLVNIRLTWDEGGDTLSFRTVQSSIRVDGNDNSGKEAVLAVLVNGEESSVKEATMSGLTEGVLRTKKFVDEKQKICVNVHFHCSQAASSDGRDTVWEQNMALGNNKLIMVVKDDEQVDLEAMIRCYKRPPYDLTADDIIFISLIPFPDELDAESEGVYEQVHSRASKVKDLLEEMSLNSIKGYFRLCSQLKQDVPKFAEAISFLLAENQKSFAKGKKNPKCTIC